MVTGEDFIAADGAFVQVNSGRGYSFWAKAYNIEAKIYRGRFANVNFDKARRLFLNF
jgi:hypothetical protein